MIDSDDLREWLILLRTPGMNARRLREGLVSRGGATPLLGWLTRHGDALGAEGRAWVAAPDEAVLARDLAWLAGDDQRLLRCTDEDFPPQLEAIPDPPAALFVKGDASLLLRPQIAIVGARRAQAPGLANARRFAEALAVGGLLVTSGMADGVDGAAHE
ncbi:DNA-processing protein DprA, partial [Luteibacter rhizovicinus]